MREGPEYEIRAGPGREGSCRVPPRKSPMKFSTIISVC